MTAADLWVLGIFQGDTGPAAMAAMYGFFDCGFDITDFYRLGKLAKEETGAWWGTYVCLRCGCRVQGDGTVDHDDYDPIVEWCVGSGGHVEP